MDGANRLDNNNEGHEEKKHAHATPASVKCIPVPPSSLGAPIAHFDEGFSSDGAFLSGAETEKDEATPTDHDSDGTKTPMMFELPRAERQPFSSTHGSRSPDDEENVVDSGLDHPIVYSHSEEDILKGLGVQHKETDEARTSLLLQQESFDTDFDEYSQSESFRTAASSVTALPPLTTQSPSVFNKSQYANFVTSASGAGGGSDFDNNENLQLKKEFEIQAISRPRCTTPVSSCLIESFVASSQDEMEKSSIAKSEAEKLKISIPKVGASSAESTSPQQSKTKSGHSRKSSKTWSEFYENMAVSTTGGRISGRTTPMSERADDEIGDIFDKNPDYQQKVPPSPVVHRRSSTDWVNFDAQEENKISAMESDNLESTIPAVAAAVSASIAALSHGTYFGEKEDNFSENADIGNYLMENADYEMPPAAAAFTEPYFPQSPVTAEPANHADQYKVDSSFSADQYFYEPSAPEKLWDQAATSDTMAHGSYTENYSSNANDNYSSNTESLMGIGSIEQNPAYKSDTHFTDYSGTATTAGFTMPDEMYSITSISGDNSQIIPGITDDILYPDTGVAYNYEGYTENYDYTVPETSTNYSTSAWDEDVSIEPAPALTTDNDIYNAPSTYTDYMTSWDNVPAGATISQTNYPPYSSAIETNENVYKEASYAENTNQYENVYKESPYAENTNQYENVYKEAPYAGNTNQYENVHKEAAYVETTSQYPTSWDDDASEVPQLRAAAFQSKPPWAYQDYTQQNEVVVEAAKPKPPPVPPPPKRPPATYVEKEKEIVKQDSAKSDESTGNEQSKEWLEYQKMTDKINLAMKQTKEKLEAMKETTIVTNLPNKQYGIKIEEEKKPQPLPENLLDMEIEEQPSAETTGETQNEWKPIHERLNEEIKKQKELNKPKRPPGPKGVPQRPPPPVPKANRSDWDDAEESQPPAPSVTSGTKKIDHYLAAWDDHTAVADYVAPSYAPPAGKHLDLSHFDTLSTMEDSSNSSLLPPPPPLDASQLASPLFGEDDQLPPPPPPLSNAASDIDDFFGVKEAPVPPPRSPITESTKHVGKWEDTFDTALPSSESDFFQKVSYSTNKATNDPFAPPSSKKMDLFTALDEESIMAESYDPFNVKPAEEIVAEVKAKTQAVAAAQEMQSDMDFFGMNHKEAEEPAEDPESSHGFGFADEFHPAERDEENRTPSPLYDEDDTLPLKEFPPAFTGDGWELMLRYPLKKKLMGMGERYWKSVYVKLYGNTIQLYYSRNDKRPFQELPLQSNYCMSDITLQQYDIYGKIHTVKVQYVLYKERVGVRPGQIPKLVEGKLTKLGLPLEHAAQTTVLLKFGSLNHLDMQSFVYCVEDVLFKIPSARERPCVYKQDEIQVHCYDEYSACVNKDGAISDQRARVRIFCLAFVSGMPYMEVGLNDRRRQGNEVVRRKDIMPMYTERWIKFEAMQFHSSVEKQAYDKDHVIKMRPLDATFFEVLRFRVRPPRGKELPLSVRAIMKLAGSKIEIRLEAMVSGFKSRKAHQVPCEDIQIRFPIPEAWIYLFREERHWGYGSVHAKVRRPGKVKNIKDRLMGMVQHVDASLIEAAIGDAKYEHVYRSLVWRIPRLPEKHHGAYKTHLLRCRFELNSFDLMPESFIPNCDVEYTMPVATVSHTVVRSVSIEQNEDPDKVEKWVRYLAKYHYKVEVDYVQTADLDIDAILDMAGPDPEKALEKPPAMHKPSIDNEITKEAHAGYRIEFAPGEFGDETPKPKVKNDSSSDSDDDLDSHKPMVINIDMKGYGY